MPNGNQANRTQPITELQPQFSSQGASPTLWTEAIQHLVNAEVFWLSTVRENGQPHVTPLVAVWLDGALYFCTGPQEQKAQNLMKNPHCVLTTGSNVLSRGTDLVIEGEAVRVEDEGTLQQLSDAYRAKYPDPFDFTLEALKELHVYRVVPTKAFGFARGNAYSQTRWRFSAPGR